MIKDFIDKNSRLITLLIIGGIVIFVVIGGILLSKSQPPATVDVRTSFIDDNPITTRLPYIDPYYTIAYKTVGETSNDIVITIRTPSPRYRYVAIEKLKAWGYDVTDYKIEFIDFKNPLEK